MCPGSGPVVVSVVLLTRSPVFEVVYFEFELYRLARGESTGQLPT
jgi:hypothetical protein